MRHKPITLSVAVAATIAVAIAACGSATKPSSTGHSSNYAHALAFANCMRSHGVPNFPDPKHGGGLQIPQSPSINPLSPAFKTAQSACAKLMPGTPATACTSPPSTCGAEHATAATLKAAMLKASQCMRHHGIPTFPDPTLHFPANPTAYSLVDDRDGVILAIPDTINMHSPAFRHAWTACKS